MIFEMRVYSFQKTEKYKNMERWQQLSVCQECGKELKPGDMIGDSYICKCCYKKLFKELM